MAKDEGGDETSPKRATGGPDAYEQKFMAGSGAVRHRERTVWRLHWILLLAPILTLVASVMGFLGMGTKPMPIPVAIAMIPFSALLVGVWAMFLALRTTVTEREVIIQYGVFGPRIPLEGVDSCEAKDYPQLAFGGGVKWVAGAWAYTLWGQGTRAVRIEWHDARGKKHATIVSSPDPDALAAAILTARAAATSGARIATTATAGGEVGEPLEEEAEGDEARRERRAP
jgi:hypothetical protein